MISERAVARHLRKQCLLVVVVPRVPQEGKGGGVAGGVAAQEGKGGPKGMVPWNEWNDPWTNSWDSGAASQQ